jgi:hypothetical protein
VLQILGSLKFEIFVIFFNSLIAANIDKLPLTNSPEVFGLHPNAEIGYYSSAVKVMWTHLVELQPQTGECMLWLGSINLYG